MNNINFANPIILIIGAILIVMTIISFCIVIRKENRNFHNVFSFICHILMCVVVSLAFAKTTYETVVTETNIYIVADVSYSSNKNLDLVDEYINNVKEDAPKNSKIGVICFGKDYQLLVRLGQEIVSVKEANVDDSATNIANALSYAGNLFKNDVIKRIVLISDGKETVKSDVVNIVKGLSEKDIYVDAIYLDNNLNDDDFEVQISQVDYNQSAYKEINESKKLRKEAEDLYATYENHTKNFEQEKDLILEEGKREVFELQKEADARLSKKINRKRQDVQMRISSIEENTRRDLTNTMMSHVMDKTKSLLSEKKICQSSKDMDRAINDVLKLLEESVKK